MRVVRGRTARLLLDASFDRRRFPGNAARNLRTKRMPDVFDDPLAREAMLLIGGIPISRLNGRAGLAGRVGQERGRGGQRHSR